MGRPLLIAAGPPTAVTVCEYHARDRLRARLGARRIDEVLARGVSPDSSVTLSLRAHTLIGIRTRRSCSRGLRTVVNQARAPAWHPVAVPLCRRKIVAAEELIEHLAERLTDGRPVAARGVAQIHLLLTNGRSPIYYHPQADDLQPALRAAAAALEPTIERPPGPQLAT
jgi:hypothetical protein